MFGFTREELETTGSAERFPIRVENFRKKKKALPLLQHGFWWFVHNCITHPLIGILPIKPLFQFHDWTSVKLTAGIPATMIEIEELEGCKKQLEKIKTDLIRLNKGEEPFSVMYLDSAISDIESDISIYYNPSPITRTRRSKKIKTTDTNFFGPNENTSFTA